MVELRGPQTAFTMIACANSQFGDIHVMRANQREPPRGPRLWLRLDPIQPADARRYARGLVGPRT